MLDHRLRTVLNVGMYARAQRCVEAEWITFATKYSTTSIIRTNWEQR